MTLTVRDEYGLTGVTVADGHDHRAGGQPAAGPGDQPAGVRRRWTCNFSSVGSADPNPGDTFSYLWNFGDGTATSTSSSPSHTFAGRRHLHRDAHRDRWVGRRRRARRASSRSPSRRATRPPTPVISTPVCARAGLQLLRHRLVRPERRRVHLPVELRRQHGDQHRRRPRRTRSPPTAPTR